MGMPLLVEVFGNEQWIEVGRLSEHDAPGSMSHTAANGRSIIYAFLCKEGDRSELYRGLAQVAETQSSRIIDLARFELVKVLYGVDNPHEIEVKTAKSPVPRRVRFTHLSSQN